MCFGYFYVYIVTFARGIGGEEQYFITFSSSFKHTRVIFALSLTDNAVGLAKALGVQLTCNLGLKIEKTGEGEFTYNYVSVDDKDRNFLEKMYRFPLPSSELTSNSLVNQFPEWN